MRMIERLDLWSLIHVAIMMVIGLTQVNIYYQRGKQGLNKVSCLRFIW